MNMLNFDTHRCEQIRRHFDAYLSNELLVETTSEVLRHVQSCQACARELESQVRLRDAVRRAVRDDAPPDELIQAVHQRLAKAQPGAFSRYHVRAWAAAAACLGIVLLAGVVGQRWLSVRQGREMVARVLNLGVRDHLICAIQNHQYLAEGRPPAHLRERLGPAYADLLDLVEQRLPGFQVLEAHQCHAGTPRTFIHFIASGRGTILSVVLTRRDGENLPPATSLVADTFRGIRLYEAQLQGMSVAGFEANDYFGFVVSDGGRSEVLDMAANLAPAIRSALPSIASLLDDEQPLEVEEASLIPVR
jgi:anti-sigma factor RsiW